MIDSAKIVGFIPDVKFASFRTEIAPMAFFVWGTRNWGSRPNWAYIKVKAGSDLRAAMIMCDRPCEHSIRSIPSISVFSIRC